jgi:hypothetical protein
MSSLERRVFNLDGGRADARKYAGMTTEELCLEDARILREHGDGPQLKAFYEALPLQRLDEMIAAFKMELQRRRKLIR